MCAGFMLMTFGGCATASDQRLDQKISQEPEVENASAVSKQAQIAIDQDDKLTPEQRVKLTRIRE